jgi:hypothetical protein
MIAVSGGLVFIGYQLLVYGWSQVNGQNAGFFDILWPGRYKGNTPDSGAIASFSANGSLNDTAQGGTIGATPKTNTTPGPKTPPGPGKGFKTPITGAH